jgi:hypothetical protein
MESGKTAGRSNLQPDDADSSARAPDAEHGVSKQLAVDRDDDGRRNAAVLWNELPDQAVDPAGMKMEAVL